MSSWAHTYFAVYWWWWERERWCGHEDWAVIPINVIQQRCERLIKVTVTGWHWWHSQGHPTQGRVANWSILTAHAAGATPKASCPNDQGQLQDQLLTAWNVDVYLEGKWFTLVSACLLFQLLSQVTLDKCMIKWLNAKNKTSPLGHTPHGWYCSPAWTVWSWALWWSSRSRHHTCLK